MRRRGIPATEREPNEPWARLQEHLALRYSLGLRLDRRWEHPDPHDLVNVPLLLRQASAVVDADLRRVLATSAPGLTPVAFDTLRRIRDKPSPGVNLGQYLRLPPQRVSEILAHLEKSGLIVRDPSSRDLRLREARVDEAGRALVERLEDTVTRLAHLWLEDLGLDEQDTLLSLVAVVAEGA
ncbi:MarR family winged helix-turn-helix transcriptional regulator [uncultured Phycicoccus sp.]|uniref:MarR family winged helix-turn-helix transcriptional regulator n=1 Tax=uncultured Phycicoccus sp. TaxID=661422 RepID=UPI002626D760|nr:MarR family transcriptional regulator [uncultured Phycicoccus sp.]